MLIHPWAAIAGVFAAGIPLLIHWLTKPRPQRVSLSTLKFVREAIRQKRTRSRLRDFFILAIRMLAILMIGFAFARPSDKQASKGVLPDAGMRQRVVILDTSQSMMAVDQGVEALERGRTLAAKHLRYEPNLRAGLVLAAATPKTVFDQLSQNFKALRDELGRAKAVPQRLDVNRAIGLASEMLQSSSIADNGDSGDQLELVIVSDFQRSNWARADFSPLPRAVSIRLESVVDEHERSNQAIVDVNVPGRVSVGVPLELELAVANFSPVSRDVTIEVNLGDASQRFHETLDADRVTRLARAMTFADSGWKTGNARIVGHNDLLAADDQWPLALQVHARPTYALVTRQANTLRPSSSHFLECALAPDARLGEQALSRVVRLAPDELTRQNLSRVDLLVVDHPRKMSDLACRLLGEMVRHGKRLLYVTSEPVDAANLQSLANVWSSSFQAPVEFAAAAPGQRRRDLRIAELQERRPPFRVFGDNAKQATNGWRLGGGLTSRNVPDALRDEVLATYGDGSTCLMITHVDAGKLAVFNADLGSSNVASNESFLPFMDELVLELLRNDQSLAAASPGEPFVGRLPLVVQSAADLTIVATDKNNNNESPLDDLGELQSESSGVVWRWAEAASPGVYSVQRSEQTVFALPVLPSAEESDLQPIDPKVIEQRLVDGRAVTFHALSDPEQERDHWWVWLTSGVVICWLAELGALCVFRS